MSHQQYQIEVVVEFEGPFLKAQDIKDWIYIKLHLPNLEMGKLRVVSMRTFDDRLSTSARIFDEER